MNVRKDNKADLTSLIYGKVPPQADNLEQVVLGALLLSPKAIYAVAEYLTPEVFYKDAHQKIYKAIFDLYTQNEPIDIVIVVNELTKRGELESVGGAYYVVTLTNSVTSDAHIESHCRVIVEKYILRSLITTSLETSQNAYNDEIDCFKLLDDARAKLAAIEMLSIRAKVTNIDKIAVDVIEKFENKVGLARAGKKNENAVYTFIPEWDRVNGELFPGLYVVGGRPSMGKGVHLTECVVRMSQNFDVGIVNAEMTNEQLIKRLGCNMLNINNYLWKKDASLVTDEEIEQLREAMNATINLKIHITDEKNIDIIASKIKYWVLECNVKVVLIDFLTMLKVSDEKAKYWTEKQQVNYILHTICGLNRKLNIPIILYAQLNRELLKRGSKEPNLGDLKESGSIEELAFQVSFLHRPEYYEQENLVDEFGESTKGLMYQIIAKHRDGELDRIKYKANLASSKLTSWQNDLPSIGGFVPYLEQKNNTTLHNNQIGQSVLGEKSGDFDEGVDIAELY